MAKTDWVWEKRVRGGPQGAEQSDLNRTQEYSGRRRRRGKATKGSRSNISKEKRWMGSMTHSHPQYKGPHQKSIDEKAVQWEGTD